MKDYYIIGFKECGEHKIVAVKSRVPLLKMATSDKVMRNVEKTIRKEFKRPSFLIFVYNPMRMSDVIFPEKPTKKQLKRIMNAIKKTVEYFEETEQGA